MNGGFDGEIAIRTLFQRFRVRLCNANCGAPSPLQAFPGTTGMRGSGSPSTRSPRACSRMQAVRVTAKVDYAVRAALELAAAGEGPVKGERIAQAQSIPVKFLENILIDLRHAGIVRAQRGAEGGYWLASPPADITLGEVIRAVEGPLASVRGEPPESVEYDGAAEHLQTVWIAVRASLRTVVDELTLADISAGKMPARLRRLTEAPDAWTRR
jgi:Rrf2 family protein